MDGVYDERNIHFNKTFFKKSSGFTASFAKSQSDNQLVYLLVLLCAACLEVAGKLEMRL